MSATEAHRPRSPWLQPRHRRVLQLVWQHWGRLLLAGICLLVEAGSRPAIAYLIKPALDDVFIKQDLEMLRLIPLVVVGVFVLSGAGMYGHSYLLNYVGQDVIRRLRDTLYSHILDLPLRFFQQEKTGVLMSRITNDVAVVKNMVSTTVTAGIKELFTIVGLLTLVFSLIWQLAIVAVLVLPLAFFPIVHFGRRVRRISSGTQQALGEMSAFLHETLAGNKIVKAFGMEAVEKQRFFARNQHLFQLEVKDIVIRALTSPLMESLAGLAIAFIIWYGGSQVIAGTYSAGTFIAFLAAVMMLYEPVKKISKFNLAMQQGLAATDRIFDVLEIESDIQEVQAPVQLPLRPHRVEFRAVDFRYEAAPVLQRIELEVRPGEVLALVGMSGGGKSTLVNLIPRFFDISAGAILIDGVDIRTVSLRSLRAQIAVVTQDPILFNDTVRNNIAYGRPSASQQEIEEAARAAYAFDFIQGFPKGFDTNIGELGGRLSGGEKQRLCIARALLKNAPILILDEATSALDTEAETIVQQALENLMRGRTTFVIAHRLSTICGADRIVTLVGGRIVEQGHHEQLLARRGEYWKLHRMQFASADGQSRGQKAEP